MDEKYLTVTALTRYLKYKFDSDSNLRKVFLKGEISNFKSHTTGHFYFSIKDENSKINAIMFRTNAAKLKFVPTEGMKVLVTGSVSVYEATGNYQIYVEDLIEDGIGNLYVAFEKLKQKLEKEGLFDPKYKKVIPKIPEKVGIVTASTGAAVRDIISTIRRRFPLCETYLFPCLVQGENAPADIVRKIKQANQYDLDVLIVGRGGGAFEDLNCFNDEEVARTIFASKTPVISAVGHEIDYTIADFVADLRAPTPTGAAELAVPNLIDLKHSLQQYRIRLNESVMKKVKMEKLYLESFKSSFVIKNPMLLYENKKQKIDLNYEKLIRVMKNKLDQFKIQLEHIRKSYILCNPKQLYEPYQKNLRNVIEKLELLNPLSVLKRGYSLTYCNSTLLHSIESVKVGDKITVRLADGSLEANVERMIGD